MIAATPAQASIVRPEARGGLDTGRPLPTGRSARRPQPAATASRRSGGSPREHATPRTTCSRGAARATRTAPPRPPRAAPRAATRPAGRAGRCVEWRSAPRRRCRGGTRRPGMRGAASSRSALSPPPDRAVHSRPARPPHAPARDRRASGSRRPARRPATHPRWRPAVGVVRIEEDEVDAAERAVIQSGHRTVSGSGHGCPPSWIVRSRMLSPTPG